MKADDFVILDRMEAGENEDFTWFEYLDARVSHIEDILNSHADIMRENDLFITELKQAKHIDEEEVFNALMGN